MSKELIVNEEQLDAIVEEIRDIKSDMMDRASEISLLFHHSVGEAIESSPLYVRSARAKEEGGLVRQIAERLGWRENAVYECMKFYEEVQKRYQQLETKQAIREIAGDIGGYTKALVLWDIRKDSSKDETSDGALCSHTCQYHEKVVTEKARRMSEVGIQIDEIISLFQPLNMRWEGFLKNKAQRSAVSALLKDHGKEKLAEIVKWLKFTNGRAYAPTIHSPVELVQKFGKLQSYAEREKGQSGKVGIALS